MEMIIQASIYSVSNLHARSYISSFLKPSQSSPKLQIGPSNSTCSEDTNEWCTCGHAGDVHRPVKLGNGLPLRLNAERRGFCHTNSRSQSINETLKPHQLIDNRTVKHSSLSAQYLKHSSSAHRKAQIAQKLNIFLKKEELWAARSINSLIKPLSTTEMKGALLLALAEGNLCICLLKLLPHKVIEQHTLGASQGKQYPFKWLYLPANNNSLHTFFRCCSKCCQQLQGKVCPQRCVCIYKTTSTHSFQNCLLILCERQ